MNDEKILTVLHVGNWIVLVLLFVAGWLLFPSISLPAWLREGCWR